MPNLETEKAITVGDLLAQLQELVEANPRAADLEIWATDNDTDDARPVRLVVEEILYAEPKLDEEDELFWMAEWDYDQDERSLLVTNGYAKKLVIGV